MTRTLALLLCWLPLAAFAQPADSHPPGLRGGTALDREAAAAHIPRTVNDDVRRGRAFAMQPPVIPHQIDNYQVDRSFNKCMSCHARDRTPETQAPMVSVTHFMDREGNFRSEISPRRYFCTQCHVPQLEVKAPVGNSFVDAEKSAAERTVGKKGAAK
jgi:nitrate reductase (cytochrome), electron transfer subunit